MKFLSDYTEDKQSQLFKETHTFFAFNNAQFKEGADKSPAGTRFVNMGMGMFTPKTHVKKVIKGIDTIYKEGIAQDIRENGVKAIIIRELDNHEAFYTWEITTTADYLSGYGITNEEIDIVFKEEVNKRQ